MIAHSYEAVNIGGAWKAIVTTEKIQVQKPDFNSKGAALAFAHSVAIGVRKAEPIK